MITTTCTSATPVKRKFDLSFRIAKTHDIHIVDLMLPYCKVDGIPYLTVVSMNTYPINVALLDNHQILENFENNIGGTPMEIQIY